MSHRFGKMSLEKCLPSLYTDIYLHDINIYYYNIILMNAQLIRSLIKVIKIVSKY